MFKFLDAYSLKARLFPAILAVAPALLALAILISMSKFGLTNLIATTVIPVLVFAAADIARRLGKRIENQIYERSGGKPSITMLRYSDKTFSAAAKKKYRTFLSSKINQPAPTEQAEKKNPKEADEFYEQGGAWLRENTRSATKFPVLLIENITYGFRRNLLGLKWPALGANLAIFVFCCAILYFKKTIDLNDDLTIRIIIVMAFTAIHFVYMVFAVSEQSVVDASRTYARQLILACESFRGK